MSKFKVGDRVRVVSDGDGSTVPGEVGTITDVPEDWSDLCYAAIVGREGDFPFYEEELELIFEDRPSYRSTALEVLRVVAEDPGATAGDRIRAAELLLVHEGLA